MRGGLGSVDANWSPKICPARQRGLEQDVQLLYLMAISRNGKSNSNPPGEMPVRLLGRTGERVSILGLGGSHIGTADLTTSEAVRIIRSALDRGLNFMDNSWDYNDGQSEI